MGKIPYFPFYPDDWLSSPRVMTMTYEQRGLYIHLLAMGWKLDGCSIPNDPALLRRLCPGARMSNILFVLESCFMLTGEEGAQRWQSPRLATEFQHALQRSDKARESFKHTERFKKQQSNDNQTMNRTIILPEPEPKESKPFRSSNVEYPSWFESFWNLYPARKGKKAGKKSTYKIAILIPKADVDLLLTATKNYAESDDCRRGFAKDPERFLKNDYWRDFVTAPTEPRPSGPPAPGSINREGFA